MTEIKGIKDIEQGGWFDFRRIQTRFWGHQVADFVKKFGIVLPKKEELKQIGKPKELRVLLSDLTITVTFTDTSWIQYKFHRGFITDLASVPRFFRNIVDNDDLDVISAALIHDANFSSHFKGMDFKRTNKLFKKMIQRRGRRFMGFLAWLAVSSPIGKRRWKALKKQRSQWTANTVEYMNEHGEKLG